MAARKKPTAYEVVGAAAVIRKDGHERYLEHGAIIAADVLDEANADHLVTVGILEPYEAPEVDTDTETPPAA